MFSVNVTVLGDPLSGKSSLIKKLANMNLEDDLKRPFYGIRPTKESSCKITLNLFEASDYKKKMTQVAERIISSDILVCCLSFAEKENEFMINGFPKTNELEIKTKKRLYNSVIQVMMQMAIFYHMVPSVIFVITKCEMEIVDTLNEKIAVYKNKFRNYIQNLGVTLAPHSLIAVSNLNGDNILTKSETLIEQVTLLDALMLKAEALKEKWSNSLPETFALTRFSVLGSYKKMGHGTIAEGFALTGDFKVGDEVVVLPLNKTTRINSIEFFNEKTDKSHKGAALGLNLKGIGLNELKRGSMICKVGHNNPDYLEIKSAKVHLHFVYVFNYINKGAVMSFVGYNTRATCRIVDVQEVIDFETVTNEWEYGNAVIGTLLIAKLDFLQPVYIERFEESECFGRFALVGSNIVYAIGYVHNLNP